MKDIITGLNKSLTSLVEHEGKELRELNISLAPIQNELKYFENNWEGGWLREDYNVYYVNKNSYRLNAEYIYEHIFKQAGIDLRKIEGDIKSRVDVFRAFNNNIIADIAFIKDDEKFKQEAQLFEKLENYEWGTSNISEIISLYRPKSLPVYDMAQLNKGILTPPHIFVTAHYILLETKCGACSIYKDLAKRLLRQIEIKIGLKQVNTSEEILTTIFNNFHRFATQLKNRHGDRDTIIIEDEYDVQDLIHALLKVHFNDIRAEEYTPSYAGSSTRMDFLLKNEQTVIEVKKTRVNLKDKEIGEQLILDIAHYKNHPDCSVLYCFIYDPENKVKNPRGLENDLSKQSNENLEIKVFIKP